MTIANPYFHGLRPQSLADAQLKKRAARASLCVATVLAGAKLAAFLATDSVSLLSSLVDSAFDAVASLFTLFCVVLAAMPPDAEHRFGHGKIEALGALAQALLLTATCVFILFEAAGRFFRPEVVEETGTGICVMVFSLALTFGLVLFQNRVVKETGSMAVGADRVNYIGDLLTNAGVILALVLVLTHYTSWPYFDPIFAVLIALRLLWGAFRIAAASFDVLLDRELPSEERKRIKELIKSHPQVKGVHDLRTRNTGERYFIECHIEVDKSLAMGKAHDAMDEIEKMVFAAFPKSEIILHPEPEGIEDHRIDDEIRRQST